MDEVINFEPDPDHSPDAGTGKSESRRSVEVGQTGTSLRAGYRSRDALQRDTVYQVYQGPGSFVGWSTFLYDVRLQSYGASNWPNFWILLEVHVLH